MSPLRLIVNHELTTILANQLSNSRIKFKLAVPGAEITTMAVGGPVAILAEPNSLEDLQVVLAEAKKSQVMHKIVGAGSNLLLPDIGLQELCLRLGRGFRQVEIKGEIVRVGAAVSLMSLSRQMSESGLSGLEFAGGIPATIGGAVRMNAGAHGGEISTLLQAVEIVTAAGDIQKFLIQDLNMSYRHCSLPNDAIVVGAELKLVTGDRQRSATLRQRYLQERKLRQPLQLPSCGSIFKNPAPNRSAGFLIEQAGLKGYKLKGAEISTMHANWIVNPNRQATADDIKGLIQLTQQKVRALSGIELQPEVVVW